MLSDRFEKKKKKPNPAFLAVLRKIVGLQKTTLEAEIPGAHFEIYFTSI